MSIHVFTYGQNNNFGLAGPNGAGINENVHIFQGADDFEFTNNGYGVLIFKDKKKVGYIANAIRILALDEPELEGDAG